MQTMRQNNDNASFVDQRGNQRKAFGNIQNIPNQSVNMVPPPPERKGSFLGSLFKKKSHAQQPVSSFGPAPTQQMQQPAQQRQQQQQQHQMPPQQRQQTLAPMPAPAQQRQNPQSYPMQAPPVLASSKPQPTSTSINQNQPSAQVSGIPPARMVDHTPRAIEEQMQANMQLVPVEMLDGSVQQLPYAVFQQLLELGLCKAMKKPVVVPVPVPVAMPRMDRMHMPMQMMHDELVELELPDGSVQMIPKSQAQQMGCVPVEDDMFMPQDMFMHADMFSTPMGMMEQPMQMSMPMDQQMMMGMMETPMMMGMMEQQMPVSMSMVQEEPLVELVYPNGEMQMLPKSQAVAIAMQIRAGMPMQQEQQSMSMMVPSYGYQPEVWDGDLDM